MSMDAKRKSEGKPARTWFLLVLGLCGPGLLMAGAAPQDGKALDLEMFKRELERSHALAAKRDRNYRKNLRALERITREAPAFPGPWTALAGIEEDAGNHRRAEEDHLRALQASDRWAGPALAYARFLTARGRREEAAALLRTVLSAQPGQAAPAFALAETVQATDPGAALAAWDALARADAERVDAGFRAASLEFSRGRFKEAFARLERLQDARPRDPEILALCAESARKAGEPGKADGYLEELALGTADCGHLELWIEGSVKDPLSACRRARERTARCPGVFVRTGEILERSGDFRGAFRSYAEAYRLDPEDRTLQGRLKNLAGQLLEPMPDPGPFLRTADRANLWSKAESEMNAGNWRKAFSTVRRIPFRKDREFDQPFLLRMAEAAKGDEELLLWADSLARTCPREGVVVFAAALQGSGRSSRADEVLRKAAEDWTMDPAPCERLGRLRAGLGLWDAAGRAYEEADRRDWRGRWILDEARCASGKGDWGRAARLYVSELGRRPFQSEAYRGLMTAYERGRMEGEALQAARLWAQTAPLSREAWEAYRRLLKGRDPATEDLIGKVLGNL
jgi:tetratricopeptide (TPR) repeat protein